MISIDLRSATPLDEQLRSQLRELIATGALVEGRALPSSRQLATDLGIHFNTVARAYRRLQDEGLLVIGRGRGVFVRNTARRRAGNAPRRVRDELSGRLRQIFVDARLLGLSTAQMHDLVIGELDHFARRGNES